MTRRSEPAKLVKWGGLPSEVAEDKVERQFRIRKGEPNDIVVTLAGNK